MRIYKNYFAIVFVLVASSLFSQGVTATYGDYKSDSSYVNFNKLKDDVAKAQIISLKKGALLVRLKTNNKTITQLKKAGNIDLATQVERETALKNKIIIFSYLQEFDFCPVYFFYSDVSDSVKHHTVSNVFVDTTLQVNSSIVCSAGYYLIADNFSPIYNSSLGFVAKHKTNTAIENGTATREATIVIKNSHFIQVHKPFPYFQVKSTVLSNAEKAAAPIKQRLSGLYEQSLREKISKAERKDLKKFKGSVYLFNDALKRFYNENKNYSIPATISEYIY